MANTWQTDEVIRVLEAEADADEVRECRGPTGVDTGRQCS